jgi:Ribosomal protein L2
MAIKTYRPTTPSRRFMTNVENSDITAKASVRSLLVKLPAHAGRNNNGRITSRHKQAGAKNFIVLSISKEISSVSKVQ